MRHEEIAERISSTCSTLELGIALPAGVRCERGKVRDLWYGAERAIISTTDRLSAFDVVLTTIPCKGEVLNRISAHWFEQTGDIVRNHLIEKLTARSVLVERCRPLPVEVVVRGYLTGSAWRDYAAGQTISGVRLEAGMRPGEKFSEPLLTPSTKAERGSHDEPLSSQEVVQRGLVDRDLWERVRTVAHALFRRGQEMVARQGLILVDTKYEFGTDAAGDLVLIDEIHTPDSSRYWYASGYEDRLARGERQRELDKEYLRQWLIERHGYMGLGTPPEIPVEVRVETAARYITAYEMICGEAFTAQSGGVVEELAALGAALPRLL